MIKRILLFCVFTFSYLLYSQDFSDLQPSGQLSQQRNASDFVNSYSNENILLPSKRVEKTQLILNNQGKDLMFQTLVSSSITFYGHDFFLNSNSFSLLNNVQVTPDYVIGPGDQLVVSIWGRLNERLVLDVLRDGTVFIPKVGVINVSGVEFDKINNFLKKEISKYYTDFELNVSMGNIRSIRVYVIGNAKKPGAYTVSGLSTMITALFAAGGPAKTGSMRNVELRRDGRTMAVFDLYDFLISGNKKGDMRLLNEDIVYIPPVGKLVAIESGVLNPAIYELKDGERLSDLIKFAGGFENTSNKKRIMVKRIFDGFYRDYIDFNIDNFENEPSKNISLEDGDVININPVIDMDSSVSVYGAVAYPGKIGIKAGETKLLDAITLAGGTMPYASDEVELIRFVRKSTEVVTQKLNLDLKKAIAKDSDNNITLKPLDSIVVKKISGWYDPVFVTVEGEVTSPGSYVIQKGERLSSLLERAGGFTKEAYPEGIIFTRESVRTKQEENLKNIILRLEKELFFEGSQSVSTSLSQEEIQSKKVSFDLKQKLIDQLKQAKPQGRIYIKLTSINELKNSPYDIELKPGDKMIIPKKSDTVNVVGAVMSEGSYVFTEKSYLYYIKKAGGYSRYADKSHVFIIRADGSAEEAGGFLFKTKVKPGDTIVVPEKFDRVAWLREIRDITQIITNIAMTTGIIIKIF